MIVAGFGFSKRATQASLKDALAQHNVEPDAVATLEGKVTTLKRLALSNGVRVIVVSDADAKAQKTHTQSVRSSTEKGTPSVAEATALAAAGPGARLISTRTISQDRMATCAIAQGPDT
ncbi:precorrin methylase [Tateyamaria omphalii]|uniref:cobalamin biosynthesis protein n=1 Tax=Tateyamaria omphalii TaxID=299262 RepID=UPI00167ACC28|nr:cobalamin biosynthesis protein [Tateyamaria omphalii]GGX49833.1 precorrin methylase [Tateyamaria omphalii]